MISKDLNKIVVLSLYEKFTNEICKTLADSLGMMYCGTNDLIEYELIDQKAMEDKLSLEYMKELEKRVVKRVASFENVCVSISYEHFTQNISYFESESIVVFVDLAKNIVKENSAIDFLRYDERKKDLEKISNITVPLRKLDKDGAVKKIIKALGGIL